MPASRFFEGYEWRWVVTDLDSAAVTWADGLLSERRIAFNLDQATVIEAAVEPDDFVVNGLWTDGYPRLAQSNRLVYCFRREAPGTSAPWRVKAAGIVMSPEDEGDPDVPTTHFTAYDPWKLLEARPVLDVNGNIPGGEGERALGALTAPNANVVALTYLKRTIQAPLGGLVRIDAGQAWGGTTFYGGAPNFATIETCPIVDSVVQQGQSVADVWNELVDAGLCDIKLDAIYDPVRRPGYTHELSIYNLAGTNRTSAVFGWDTMTRNLSRIARMHDGTPGQFFNIVQYFAGAGAAIENAAAPITNNDSITAFGRYWSMQFFPSLPSYYLDPVATVLAMEKQALSLAKQGKRTLTLTPIPELAPIPLVDYDLGDRVAVYATNRLRALISSSFAANPVAAFRVQSIPVEISDDGIETIAGLVVSPDWRGGASPDPNQVAQIESLGGDVAVTTARLPQQRFPGTSGSKPLL